MNLDTIYLNELDLLHGWLERSRGGNTRRAGFVILVDFDFRWGRGGGECVCGGGREKETEVDASKIFYLRAQVQMPIIYSRLPCIYQMRATSEHRRHLAHIIVV